MLTEYFTVVNLWFGMGQLANKPYVYKYVTSTVGCNATDFRLNIANVSLSEYVYDPASYDPHAHYR